MKRTPKSGAPRRGWSAATSTITPDRADNYRGFPDGYRDGLPASHGQHTCILLLNVTQRCNYGCPTCYADAHPPGTAKAPIELPTLDEIDHTIDTMLEREGGKLGVLMLSGGEPTLRDDLEQIVERALNKNITRVLINTNGRRIARDAKFVRMLERFRERVEIYLQWDGPNAGAALHHRGEDVRAEKTRALKAIGEARLWSTLVMTVARGVNEGDVGAVLQLGLQTPRCSGLAIQPLFGSGRSAGFDPDDRVTPTGITRRIGEQTDDLVTWQDFLPLPCSHRDCCDISYLLQTRDGSWKSLPALIGRDELQKWLHLVSNTISFESVSGGVAAMLGSGALARVFSESGKVSGAANRRRHRQYVRLRRRFARNFGRHLEPRESPGQNGRENFPHHGQTVHGRAHLSRSALAPMLRSHRNLRGRPAPLLVLLALFI